MKKSEKRLTQQINPELVDRVRNKYPGGSFGEALDQFIQSLEKEVETLKAGQEAGLHLETSLQSSVTSKLEPASPATYDWTHVPECPLRYEERNICYFKKPGRKAIIEQVEPWMCQRCQYTLKINEKVAEIENKAIQERLRTSDWLHQHQLEKSEPPAEQSSQPEIGYTPSKPTGFVPKRLSELRGPDNP